MASKPCSSLALFLLVNLLFFSMVSACNNCPGGSYPRPRPRPRPIPSPSPGTGGGPGSGPGTGGGPGSGPGTGGGPGSGPGTGGGPGSGPGTGGGPGSGPGTGTGTRTCPRDALKLGICANVLNGLVNVTIGQPPVTPCCTLIQGLADLEAAICLCTAIRASILGININLPISLSLLLNVCSRQAPRGFQCP